MIDEEKSFNAICKFLAWLSFSLFITFFGLSNVLASEHEMGRWTDYTQVLLEVPGAGAPIGLNKDTYNVAGHFTQVYVLVGNISINKDYIYQFEISTPGSNFTNVNAVLVNQTVSAPGINQSCNMLGFADASIGYPKVYFQCPTSFTNGDLVFTLYNINGANLTAEPQYFKWGYSNFRYYDDVQEIDWGPITSNANQNAQNIINNQNQNTQSIISNQQSMTSAILSNNYQNTRDIINSNKVCNDITINSNSIYTSNSILNNTGATVSSTYTTGVTDFIDLTNVSSIINTVSAPAAPPSYYFCTYDSNKTKVNCYSRTQFNNATISIGTTEKFARFTVNSNSNSPQFKFTQCKNGNQALDDSINGLNDSLNDDNTNGATSEASDFFEDFTTNTFGLTSIITAPLNLVRSVLSATCAPLHLPLPYLNNKYLDLPCMSTIYSTYFGAFFTVYQTITYGIIAYWVCVRIFNQVKDFKNPEHDEIEVMDL